MFLIQSFFFIKFPSEAKNMKFSNMILQITNVVRAYVIWNLTREDVMNDGEIPQHANPNWKRAYLTLFFAMWSFPFGSFLHWISEAGGRLTVLSSVASLLCLHFISPLRVRTVILPLMIAAFSFGASICIVTKHFFEIDLDLVFSILAPPTLGIGFFWFKSLSRRERSEICMGCLGFEVVLCKTLEDVDLNAWGKGLRVVTETWESTQSPTINMNPLVALPSILVMLDEFNQQWEMEIVHRKDGPYMFYGWYLFANKHELKSGDVIKIWRLRSDVMDNKFHITVQRDGSSLGDSN